ncbi:MAG: hypothetical protein ACE5R3_00465 [Nitrosopumilaceae archaeon]
MMTKNAAYLSWLWPLGFLGFVEPILFSLFAFGPIGTGLAIWASKKEDKIVQPICCCCGVMISDKNKKSLS